MDFFKAMEVSASGLAAERTRINVTSSNLANVNTTRGADGGPYKRRDIVLASKPLDPSLPGAAEGQDGAGAVFGVEVQAIQEDQAPPRMEYDPGHPDANPDGYVAYPNINVVEEMVDMITASRAYQAGMTALDTALQLSERTLGIGK